MNLQLIWTGKCVVTNDTSFGKRTKFCRDSKGGDIGLLYSTFSHSLAQRLWVLLLLIDWLVQTKVFKLFNLICRSKINLDGCHRKMGILKVNKTEKNTIAMYTT